MRPAPLETFERDDAEDLADAVAVLPPRHALHLEPKGDVVVDGHVREERVLLEHHVQRPLVRRDRGDIATLEHDAAFVRHLEARGIIRSVVVFPAPCWAAAKSFAVVDGWLASVTAAVLPKRLLTPSRAMPTLRSVDAGECRPVVTTI